MRCPGCAHENIPQAKFCAACGAPLPLPCPGCGTVGPPGSAFCIECGAPLAPPAFAPRPPQSYTPPHLAEQILRGRARLEGERKQVTVMFADAKGFTLLATRLDPEEVHAIMDGAFRILLDQIHRHEGTINQFLGDGVMALFGVPLVREDGPRRAVAAALSIQGALAQYSAEVERRHGLPFRMRIGIHTGMVVVGTIGNDLRTDFTAAGDVTILAERLESATEPGEVTISETTFRMVRAFFRCKPVLVPVKHQPEPVLAYRVLEPLEPAAGFLGSELTPFVGRARELDRLAEAYAWAAAGEGRAVAVVGDAGIGKSRLITEFLAHRAPGHPLVLRGLCESFGGTIPFFPVVAMLRRHFGITERDPEEAVRAKVAEGVLREGPALGESLPYIQFLLGADPGVALPRGADPKQVRARTVEALLAFLRALAGRGPVVLVLEGLQWADQPTLAFLEAVLDHLGSIRLLLCVAYRPPFAPPWSHRPGVTHIVLQPLDQEESAQVVAGMLGVPEVPADLREPILRRGEGVPFYLEEVTHAFLERGAIARAAEGATILASPGALEVPETIQQIIQSRLDRLEDPLKRTLQLASVIGREFALVLLQEAAQRGEETRRHVEDLQRLELVYEKARPAGEYIFKHALTHDVAYHTILVTRRKALHALVGRAIEAVYRDRLDEHVEILAHHFARSEESDRAVRYLSLAGDKAARLHAAAEARAYYGEALKRLEGVSPGPETARRRIDLCLRLANVSFYSEAISRNLELLRAAAAAAADLKDVERLARATLWIGRLHYARGDQENAIASFRSFLPLAEQVGDPELLALHYNLLGRSYQLRGDFGPAVECLEEGIRRMEALGNASEVALSLSILAFCHAYRGDLPKALATCRRALEVAEAAKHPVRVGGACAHLGLILADFAPGPEADAYLERAAASFEGTGETFLRFLVRAGQGLAALRRGDPAAALRLLGEGLAFAREIGTQIIVYRLLAQQAEATLALGNLQGADAALGQAADAARAAGDRHGEGIVALARGRWLAAGAAPELGRAEAELRWAAGRFEELGAHAFLGRAAAALAEVLDRRGSPAEAARWRDRARALFRAGGFAWDLEALEREGAAG